MKATNQYCLVDDFHQLHYFALKSADKRFHPKMILALSAVHNPEKFTLLVQATFP